MVTDDFYEHNSVISIYYSTKSICGPGSHSLNEYGTSDHLIILHRSHIDQLRKLTGLSHQEDPHSGEYHLLYRVRDIDLRGRRMGTSRFSSLATMFIIAPSSPCVRLKRTHAQLWHVERYTPVRRCLSVYYPFVCHGCGPGTILIATLSQTF